MDTQSRNWHISKIAFNVRTRLCSVCDHFVLWFLTLFGSCPSGARASVRGFCGQADGGAARPKTHRASRHREEVIARTLNWGSFSNWKLSRSNCRASSDGGGSHPVPETFSVLIVHTGGTSCKFNSSFYLRETQKWSEQVTVMLE